MIPFAVALVLTGCGKQQGCNVFGAENYDPDAVIDDGSCVEMRDKFIGLYSVNSDCFTTAFLRNITETNERFAVEVSGIGDTLGTVTATVSGMSLKFDPEVQYVRSGVAVTGAGTYDTATHILSMSVRITDTRTGTPIITNCLDQCVKN